MSNKRALFPGDSEIDQIHRIFKCLGTPSEAVWKNCTNLPHWRDNFPVWGPSSWLDMTPRLPLDGRDLLKVDKSQTNFILD